MPVQLTERAKINETVVAMREFLENQTWPHDQIRLVFCDTSDDELFSWELRSWLSRCDYADCRHYWQTVGEAGLDCGTRESRLADRRKRLQKFAIQYKLLDKPVFEKLEKPRVGRRDRIPTPDETAALLAQASPEFRLVYSALRQCGARPGEICRTVIADIDRPNRLITLKEHKTARKTGQPRRIPIGRKFAELLDQAVGTRTEGPVFLSPTGRAWTVANLSRTYSRLRDLAGLPKDLVLYLARHECGTKICREKGIEYARRLLGHTNITTTQRYMHLDEKELADAQDLVE